MPTNQTEKVQTISSCLYGDVPVVSSVTSKGRAKRTILIAQTSRGFWATWDLDEKGGGIWATGSIPCETLALAKNDALEMLGRGRGHRASRK